LVEDDLVSAGKAARTRVSKRLLTVVVVVVVVVVVLISSINMRTSTIIPQWYHLINLSFPGLAAH